MIWIVALLCLGLSGLAGFYQGPIRGGFAFLGVLLGTLLAAPVARIISPLLSLFGVTHPIWSQVLPLGIAFFAIFIVVRIIGSSIHQKVTLRQKYGQDDSRYYRWERVFQRLGLVTGLFCGAFYFFLLMMPVYVAGYFTLQLESGEDAPASSRIINNLRAEIHSQKLDRILAAYDPTPARAYKVGDTLALLLKNRLLQSRLTHYPAFLSLGERAEFRALANDLAFQKLFTTQASARELLKYPKIQAIVTNRTLLKEITQRAGDNLDDLYDYLNTGKSPKFDSEKIVGTWTINVTDTVAQQRRKAPANLTALQLAQLRSQVTAQVLGLSLVATTDNQAALRKETVGQPIAVLARGTWAKAGEKYEITLPDSTPAGAEVVVSDDRLQLIRNGATMVFDRDL